jgi:hypothetical protein
VLVIDPDFFIVREEALFEMITYMKRRGLGLLGVPWHPRHFIKYRAFPCLHCLMIDTNLINRSLIDFQPIYEHGQFTEITDLPVYKSSLLRVMFFKLIETLDKILLRLGINLLSFEKRATIGRSMDTGARIYYQYYSNSPCIHELLSPIRHNYQNASAGLFQDRLDKFFDLIMPAFLKLDPGGYGQCKSKFLDVNPETSPEEFCWNSNYFGFHLRLFPKDANSQDKILIQLKNWISR